MIRVLLALKPRMWLEAIAAILSKDQDFQVVATASNGLDVLQKVGETKTDVAVLSWYLPLLNGLETTRQITARSRQPAVILIADSPEDRSNGHALRAGARACLGTQSPLSDLPKVIRQVAGNGVFLGRGSDPVTAAAIQDRPLEPPERLTARERQILQLIAEGHTNNDTARVLGISAKTADRHRTALMEKLDIHDVVNLTRYAVRQHVIEP